MTSNHSLPKVLAISGLKGSGKTSLAHAISQSHSYIRIPLAAPIKAMLTTLLSCQGLTQESIYGMLNGPAKEIPSPHLAGKSPRYAMQTLGTEWRNLLGENLWLDIWTNTIQRFPKVIVDDLRFPHELKRVKSLGGTVIRIVRPGITPDSSHYSENQISDLDVDFEFNNDSTILSLLDALAQQMVL